LYIDNYRCTIYLGGFILIINKNDPTPIYIQIANWIREKIYSNEWETDERIPSEIELMKMLNVSRGTIKKALLTLTEEGLLIQVHGKGTFVSSNTVTHPMQQGLLSFAESLSLQGLDFKTKVIKKENRLATHAEREKLKLSSEYSKILYLERIRYVENEPIMLIENRINVEVCPGLEFVDFNRESLFKQIEITSGKKIKYAHSLYAARKIGQERAKYLEVNEESPTLHLEQNVFLEGNIPVEWGNVWLKGNRYIVGTIVNRT